MGYRTLDSDRIIVSLDQLEHRITERFPAAGLSRVCAELATIAREHSARAERIAERNWPLILAVVAVLLGCTWLLWTIIGLIDISKTTADNVYTVLQGIEATMNILVLMGAAVFFLISIEDRVKRRRALAALHELRSIVHVIDMHQLTKDPSAGRAGGTASSPKRSYTPFELARYLDYCSEMLSLAAKVAALYAQSFPDPVVTEAVGDIGQLASNMSQKIWQKINITLLSVPHAIEDRSATPHGGHGVTSPPHEAGLVSLSPTASMT